MVGKESQVKQDAVYFCLPVRLAVLLAATVTFVSSVLYVCSPSWWRDEFRYFLGGYCMTSRIVINITASTGLFFAFPGMWGAWYAKEKYVMTYNAWQLAKLLGWVWVWCKDVPLLWRCESWVNDIDSMVASRGWNSLMYNIALDGECGNERFHYFLFSGVTFVAFLYTIWVTTVLQTTMNTIPKHLLRLPKDVTAGAFFSHSPGERTALAGDLPKPEVNNMRDQGMNAAFMPGAPYGGVGPVPGPPGTAIIV